MADAKVPTTPSFTKGASLGSGDKNTQEQDNGTVNTLSTGSLRSNVNSNRNLRNAKSVHYGGPPPVIPVNSDPSKPPAVS